MTRWTMWAIGAATGCARPVLEVTDAWQWDDRPDANRAPDCTSLAEGWESPEVLPSEFDDTGVIILLEPSLDAGSADDWFRSTAIVGGLGAPLVCASSDAVTWRCDPVRAAQASYGRDAAWVAEITLQIVVEDEDHLAVRADEVITCDGDDCLVCGANACSPAPAPMVCTTTRTGALQREVYCVDHCPSPFLG